MNPSRPETPLQPLPLRFLHRIVALFCTLLISAVRAADFTPLDNFPFNPDQTAPLARSLSLLRSAGPNHHPTIRVLFYGQSITAGAWWMRASMGSVP